MITKETSRRLKLIVWILVLQIFSFHTRNAANVIIDNNTIPITLLIPKIQRDGGCTRAVMEMAIADVNMAADRNSIGINNITYKLKGYFEEIGESKRESVTALNKLYRTSPIKLATIGVPYQSQNAFVLDFVYQYDLPYFSYSSTELPMRENFNRYIQLSTFVREQFHVAIKLMKDLQWKHFSMISDATEPRYDDIHDLFIHMMRRNNFTSLTSETLYGSLRDDKGSKQLERIHNSRSRINFGLVSVHGARKIFCQAFQRKMHKQKIIWVLFETLPKNWASDEFNVKDENGNYYREIICSPTELQIAAHGYVSIVNADFRKDNKKTISGMTVDELHSSKLEPMKTQEFKHISFEKCRNDIGLIYDTVWLVAKMFAGYGTIHDVFNYTYNNNENKFDKNYSKNFMDILQTIKFEGITGPIKFNKLQQYKSSFDYTAREGPSDVWINYRESQFLYAYYKNRTETLHLISNAKQLLFGESEKLNDRISISFVDLRFTSELRVAFLVLTSIGICIAVLMFISAVCYARSKNSFVQFIFTDCPVFLGCILCYVSVIIYGMDREFLDRKGVAKFCYLFLVFFLVGFSLVFGALFGNIWHIYKKYISTRVKITDNGSVKIKEYPLWMVYFIVFIFAGLDIAYITVLAIQSPIEIKTANTSEYFSLTTGKKEIGQLITCSCAHQMKYTIVMYCHKGLLLLFGIFIAWQTRVKTKKLQIEETINDIAVYNIASITVIGVVCVHALHNAKHQDAVYTILSLCLIIGATTTLALVFYEKLWELIVNAFRLFKNRHLRARADKDSSSCSTGSSVRTTKSSKKTSNSSTELQDVERGDSSSPVDLSPTTSFTAPSRFINEDVSFDNENTACDSNCDNNCCSSIHIPSDIPTYIEDTKNTANDIPKCEGDNESNDYKPQGDGDSSYTSKPLVTPTTSYTDGIFGEETVNDEGILSTSGIYVGDNCLHQLAEMSTD